MSDKSFFDSEFLKKLEYLSILSKKIFSGGYKGEWRTRHYGSSVEFADYKNYSAGDDFRYIDWNAFGRLEQLFLKLFLQEEELNVYILLDTSKSMDFGNPTKLDYAKKIAAAFAYMALANLDKVSLYTFRHDIIATQPSVRGKAKIFSIFDFLEKADCDGQTNLSDSAKKFSVSAKRSGVVIIISDFFDSTGYETALKNFLYKKSDVFAIQILAREEVDPQFIGDFELTDSENGAKINVTLGEKGLEKYRTKLNQFCAQIEVFSKKRGIYYSRSVTDSPFEDLILKYFRQRHMVG